MSSLPIPNTSETPPAVQMCVNNGKGVPATCGLVILRTKSASFVSVTAMRFLMRVMRSSGVVTGG